MSIALSRLLVSTLLERAQVCSQWLMMLGRANKSENHCVVAFAAPFCTVLGLRS